MPENNNEPSPGRAAGAETFKRILKQPSTNSEIPRVQKLSDLPVPDANKLLASLGYPEYYLEQARREFGNAPLEKDYFALKQHLLDVVGESKGR